MRISDITDHLLNQPERDRVQLVDNLALEEYRIEHFESYIAIRDCEMRFKVNLSPLLSSLILFAVLQNLASSARGKFAISFFLLLRLTQNSGTRTCLGKSFLSLSSLAY